MNVCPVCGAANPTATNRCLGCGEPLDVRPEPGVLDEVVPLPPLPDGGLTSAMPDWLRPTEAGGGIDARVRSAPAPPDPYDPATFLTAEDLPAWLRALAEPGKLAAPSTLAAPEDAGHREAAPGASLPDQPRQPIPTVAESTTVKAIGAEAAIRGGSLPQRASRSQPGARAPGSAAQPADHPKHGTRDAPRGAAGSAFEGAAAARATPAAGHRREPGRGEPHPGGRLGDGRLRPSGAIAASPVREPNVGVRPRRRRAGSSTWLPALLLLLLIAAVALLVVQTMPGG